jgi:alkylation response protein AidB-like acyl-CoA dehydrogenase
VFAEQSAPVFDRTPEQRALREVVRALLADRAPVSRAREPAEHGRRHDPELWAVLAADIGVPGLLVPEHLGGSGAGLTELAAVVEEAGRVLLGGPLFPTAGLAVPALLASADDGACADLLPGIAGGTTTATLAVPTTWRADDVAVTADDGTLTGTCPLVLDGADADLVLVAARGTAGVRLYAVDGAAAGLRREPLATLDLTRTMAHLALDRVPARAIGAGWDAVLAARDVAAVLMAAEQVGGMDAAVAATAEHARTRRQFGRPVGAFQGVKHRLADMAVRLELARSATEWAAWQRPGAPEFRVGALVARIHASEAYLQTAMDMVQLHGGTGFTWEHDAHLHVRRARADHALLGTPAALRAELAPLIEGAA